MISKRRENGIKGLVNLYTVVIGVALSLAVVGLVDMEKGLESITLPATFLFVAFVATLCPFYHGALCHIDEVYLSDGHEHVKRGALIFDFALLLLHSLVFVVLALLLRKPNHFGWVLVGLFGVDILWSVLTHFGASAESNLTPEKKWGIINVIFVVIVVSYFVAQDIYVPATVDVFKVSLLLMIASLTRSLVDYMWCSSLYFPE